MSNLLFLLRLAVLLMTFLIAGSTPVEASVELYGTSLNGFNRSRRGPSSLYRIDQTTGAGTLVGSIGHAINGLTFDQTTGTLYGSTTQWNSGFNGLVSIDPITGASTTIGTGFGLFNVWGITVDSSGNMFGWTEGGDDLVRVNKSTGVATVVGPAPTGTLRDVLAFDNSDTLHLVRSSQIYNINTATGGGNIIGAISDPGDHGDFHPTTNDLWTVLTTGRTQDSFIRVSNLSPIGVTATINTDIEYLHTLAFATNSDTGVVPEPTSFIVWGLLGAVGLKRRRR